LPGCGVLDASYLVGGGFAGTYWASVIDRPETPSLQGNFEAVAQLRSFRDNQRGAWGNVDDTRSRQPRRQTTARSRSTTATIAAQGSLAPGTVVEDRTTTEKVCRETEGIGNPKFLLVAMVILAQQRAVLGLGADQGRSADVDLGEARLRLCGDMAEG
jgi:hypothetical protein